MRAATFNGFQLSNIEDQTCPLSEHELHTQVEVIAYTYQTMPQGHADELMIKLIECSRGLRTMTGSQPKASFSCRLPSGDRLNLAIWAGKRDPEAEVLTASVGHRAGNNFEEIGKLSVYRTSKGNYYQLPESQPKDTQEQGTVSN